MEEDTATAKHEGKLGRQKAGRSFGWTSQGRAEEQEGRRPRQKIRQRTEGAEEKSQARAR